MSALLEKRASIASTFVATVCLVACSSGPIAVGDDRVAVPDSGGGLDTGGAGGSAMDANGPRDVVDAFTPPTAGDLIGITSTCANRISTDLLSPRPNDTPSVAICQLSNAIFWTSGLAVLCSGKVTTTCNASTDDGFQAMTTATDSMGGYLDAAVLPYVEVSAPTSRFDYTMFNVKMGTVVAVVDRENLKVGYGIVGTVGQPNIIGDASYAMADSIGIDPNPKQGGRTTNTVTYIAFNNPNVTVAMNENHDEAVRLGQAAAAALVQAGK
jgi:hypothetical protein